QLDVARLLATMSERPRMGVFVFAPDPDSNAGRVYSRMFAPHTSGVPEDPATGSASGPLGAYLVLHGLVKAADEVRIVSEQGTKMKRQSFVHIRLTMTGERVDSARVRGRVVPLRLGDPPSPLLSPRPPAAPATPAPLFICSRLSIPPASIVHRSSTSWICRSRCLSARRDHVGRDLR